jgi:tetratricopeptide (TPR) repeat protein
MNAPRGFASACAFIVLLSCAYPAVAQEEESAVSAFSLTARPAFNVPVGAHVDIFGFGGSLEVAGDFRMPFLSLLQAGPAVGYTLTSIQDLSTISVLNGGARIGLAWRVVPPLILNAFIDAGYYYAFANDQSVLSGLGGAQSGGGGPYIAFAAGAEYLLNPTLGIGLSAGYRALLGFSSDVRLQAGVTYHFRPPSSTLEQELRLRPAPLSTLSVEEVQIDTVFPVFYKYYDPPSLGSARLRTLGAEPLNDIKVSLFVPQYMDGPKAAHAVDHLGPGEETRIDLFALFADKVLGITEGTKVTAQIVVEAVGQGRSWRNESQVSVSFYDRNALSWDDSRKAAAYVTMKDPAVLRFSKHVAAAIKGKASAALNRNLLAALALHNALRVVGLSYVVDPSSSYSRLSQDAAAVDFVQFPRQTFAYRSGDCDDLSVLASALLEAVGIETAFITTPGHIYIGLSLDLDAQTARTQFSRPEDLVLREGRAWLPLEITEISGGFLRAWDAGAREWRAAVEAGQAGFWPVHEAWKAYEPVGLPGEGEQVALPDEARLVSDFSSEVNRYVEQEVAARASVLQAEIRARPDNIIATNRLGVLYASFGLLDKAEEQFQKILSRREYPPALINSANIAWLREDFSRAADLYQRASRLEPGNAVALLGLARVSHMAQNYGSARTAYGKLKEVAPDLAVKYAYLAESGQQATRADEASRQEGMVEWQQ